MMSACKNALADGVENPCNIKAMHIHGKGLKTSCLGIRIECLGGFNSLTLKETIMLTTFEALAVGAEFIDATYGALWQKMLDGALCICGAGPNKSGEVKPFSPHFRVEVYK